MVIRTLVTRMRISSAAAPTRPPVPARASSRADVMGTHSVERAKEIYMCRQYYLDELRTLESKYRHGTVWLGRAVKVLAWTLIVGFPYAATSIVKKGLSKRAK